MSLPLAFPTATPFDVVGLGFNTLDHVCVVPRPPQLDTKQRMRRYLRQPGGQIPTALVALVVPEKTRNSTVSLVPRARFVRFKAW